MTTALDLTDLTGRHGQLAAIRGLSLAIGEYQTVALIAMSPE